MSNKKLAKNLLRLMQKANYSSSTGSQTPQNIIRVSGRRHSTVLDVKIEDDPIRKTSLYDLHLAHDGRMVKFAGYYLPIQYGSFSISSSHLHTRSSASLFDVSHMLQTRISGRDCIDFLESLCVTDIRGMKNGQSALSLFTSAENGGILDDFIVTKIDENTLYLVSNASRQDVDKGLILNALNTLQENGIGDEVFVEFFDSDEKSLIAVQGPKSMALLQKFTDIDLSKLYFMNSVEAAVANVENCRVTRCGYTGEDGFEISASSDRIDQLVDTLLKADDLRLAGLGARDSLRLEAGLCLFGNDINESTTPVEAGLLWTIGKNRRQDKKFNGAEKILSQTPSSANKRRIGLVQNGGPPGRSGCKLLNDENQIVGLVTSGCPSPSLAANIAMAYVPPEYAKIGTRLRVQIRGNTFPALVSKMPFVAAQYYTKPK